MFRNFQLFAFSLIVLTILGFSEARWANAQTQEKASTKAQVKKAWVKAGWEFEKSWTPATEEAEAKTWGEELAKAIAEDDIASAQGLIDFDVLNERSIDGITSQNFRKGFKGGADQGVRSLIAQFAADGTSYDFLGVKQTPFGPSPLMRMVDANGACNYYLWRLYKTPKNKLVGADIYIFLTGESFGDTMRRLVLLSAPKGEQTFFQKLVGAEKEMAKHQVKLMEMLGAVQAGDTDKILNTYASLPKSLKREKFLQITHLTTLANGSEDDYVEAIEEFKKIFPDDPSVDLVTLDLYYIKKQFEEMYQALDRIEKVTGPDAHLLTLRSAALMEEKKYDEASEVLEKAVKAEPKFENAYWNAIKVALAKKDLDSTNKLLKTIVETFGYNQFDFASDPMFAPFIGSEQQKDFEAFLKKKAAVK